MKPLGYIVFIIGILGWAAILTAFATEKFILSVIAVALVAGFLLLVGFINNHFPDLEEEKKKRVADKKRKLEG